MASARPGSVSAFAASLPRCAGGVCVTLGEVPRFLPDAIVRGVLYEASREALLIQVPDVASLLVRRDEIWVSPIAGDAEARLGPWLRRTPLMALLLLRGGFACSGAAVAGNDGAVLITGATASGKSTLAAALLKRGLRLMADDAAPVLLAESEQALIAPVWPELILWDDAVKALFGAPPAWLERGAGELPCWNVAAERFCATDQPLRRIYALGPAQGVGQEAFVLPPLQIEIAAALADPAALARLNSATDMVRFERVNLAGHSASEMEAVADRILEDCGWR